MSDDDDGRDVARPRPRVEFRPVPGFARYRVGSDRSVWFNETPPGKPAPWDVARWRRLKPFPLGGSGAFVRLRQGGRDVVRSVPLLFTFAWGPDPERWAGRVGRKFSRSGATGGPSAAAIVDSVDVPPAPPPGLPPMRCGAGLLDLLDQPPPAPPPSLPPPVELRPIPGFPAYRVGSDRSVWTCLVPTAHGSVVSDPPVWRPKALVWGGRRTPRVYLSRDGRESMRSVAKLHREAYPPVPVSPPEPMPACGPNSEGAAGELNGRARLDDAKVAEARRLKVQGWTYPQLVARYGVGKVTLFYAVTGRTWRHVPRE